LEAEGRSQRSLVTYFESARISDQSELIYFDEMPHSGDFYAEGYASDIRDKNRQRVLEELSDPGEDFFAVDDDDLEDFPVDEPRLIKVATFGDFSVFRERIPTS
jgi:hypothetical protein